MDYHFISPSGKTAFLSKTGSLSYTDFLKQIAQLASGLQIEPGDRVVLYGPNSIAWAASVYAIWRKGGIAVPLDFGADLEDLSFMLKDADAKAVFLHSEYPGIMAKAQKSAGINPTIHLFDQSNPESDHQITSRDRPLDETAIILYTSGTTAEAKGVELSFRSLLFNIEAVRQSTMVTADDRLLALFPFHHIVPLQGHILCPLKIGATVCMAEELTAESIGAAFQKHHITVLNGVPQLYQRFHGTLIKKIKANPAGRIAWVMAGLLPWQSLRKRIFAKVHHHFGGQVKYFLSGGAALPKTIADDFSRLGFTIIEGYGMTEMGPLITFNTPIDNRLGSVGKPVPGVDVRIVDDEVQVRSPGLMNGYFRRPDLTHRVMEEGWLKTGDLGHFDKEGFMTLTGRRSDILILSSGKNINAPKIEEFLGRSELVNEAGLTVRNDRLFALIYPDMEEVKRQGILNLREAIKWRILDGYNRKCAPHDRILNFGICAKPLPRTRLGKLKRHLLSSFIEPHTPKGTQQNVTEIDGRIIEYLHHEGITNIHPQAHLTIDLGLDSLALIEFKGHLEKNYGIELSETIFIEYPSLSDLDGYLRELEKGTQNAIKSPVSQNRTLFKGEFRGWIRPIIFLAGLPFGIRRSGLEHLSDIDQPLIIVSNHQSFLDPLFILRVLPKALSRNTFFMAKTRIFNSWLGRRILPRLNTVLLDLHQSGEQLLNQSRDLLHQGKSLMIFPEGTRSFDGHLGPFSRTFAILAQETGARIVPLLIEGAYDLMPRTRLIPRFGRVKLTILPVLSPPYPDSAALSEAVHRLFRDHLEVKPCP